MTRDVWGNIRRPHKALAREFLFRGIPRRRSALFMPAAECHCVKKALEFGVIDERTRLIAIERQPATAWHMIRNLKALKLQAEYHIEWLHNTMLRRNIDFAFMDLNGTITYETAAWISDHLSSKLNKGAHICITMAYSTRNNRFMPLFEDTINAEFPNMIRETADMVESSDFTTVMPVVLFRALLSGWTFDAELALKYIDRGSTPMTAYKFSKFKKATVSGRTLTDIVTPEMMAQSHYQLSRNEIQSAEAAYKVFVDLDVKHGLEWVATIAKTGHVVGKFPNRQQLERAIGQRLSMSPLT